MAFIKNFVALDFETADTDRHICSIGLVKVVNNEIIIRKKWLIRPPEDRYGIHNTRAHKLTANDTINSPTFLEVFDEFKSFVEGEYIVAQKAINTEKNILEKECEYFDLGEIPLNYICTYAIYNKGLADLCYEHDIPLNHHDPLSDAEACAILFIKYDGGFIVNDYENGNIKVGYPEKSHSKDEKKIFKTIKFMFVKDFEYGGNSFEGKTIYISGSLSERNNDYYSSVIKKKFNGKIIKSIYDNPDIVVLGYENDLNTLDYISKNQGSIKVIQEYVLFSLIRNFGKSLDVNISTFNIKQKDFEPNLDCSKYIIKTEYRPSFSGKRVLITGELDVFPSRDKLYDAFIDCGATKISGVTKNLNYLIIGDTGAEGVKLSKMKELQSNGHDIKCLTSNDLETMIIIE